MRRKSRKEVIKDALKCRSALAGMVLVMLALPFNIFSENLSSAAPEAYGRPYDGLLAMVAAASDSLADGMERPNRPVRPPRRSTSPISNLPDSFPANLPAEGEPIVVLDSVALAGDSLSVTPIADVAVDVEHKYTFSPDPTRAVWMSALFPGLGQLYNRRYWKLPIVVGAFMGLGYATNWNNTMLRDYTRAYSDIMDNDPTSNSYMDFFAPTVKEENLDKNWLTDLLRRRKNYYRRNRDLCIICIVGVYALAMIDAYVDAQLSHFDITPDLSVDIAPTLIPNETRKSGLPGIGLYWAFNF